MLRALLVSALVGGVCGLLSCYMTLKGWALMGDAVSHAVLPGVVVAYALGLPFSLGAFVFGVGSVAAIGFVKQKSRVKEDTVIGLVFTGFFALGLVLVSKTRSNIDLTHILFGNVLGINAADIVQTLLISLLVLVTSWSVLVFSSLSFTSMDLSRCCRTCKCYNSLGFSVVLFTSFPSCRARF